MDFCRWYEVYRGKDVFEVEVYGSALSGGAELDKYLTSLRSLSGAHFRKPVEILYERGLTLVLRPQQSGYPLYTLLLKPGRLPMAEACEVIRSFENIHNTLLSALYDNFSPLALLFYYSKDSKEVILDGEICGPWINHFHEVAVLYDYLNPDLDWPSQVNYFRSHVIQKLLLGKARQVSDDLPADFIASKAICELLRGVIKEPQNHSLSLSSLEKKYRKPRVPGIVRIVALLITILLVALMIRRSKSSPIWQGESIPQKSQDQKSK